MPAESKPRTVGGRLGLYRALDALIAGAGGAVVFVRADEMAGRAQADLRGADYALHDLGRKLIQLLEDEQTLFRFGNAEYVLVLPHAQTAQARAVAARIRAVLARARFATVAEQIGLGIETAWQLVAPQGSAEQVLLHARRALARSDEGDAPAGSEVSDIDWGTRLERALERGELAQAYQSLIPLGAESREHFDVLLRLIDPERGRVPAAEFVPAAEERGLMGRIDQRVLEQTLDIAEQHAGGGLPSCLIVRLSETTLADIDGFLKRQAEARQRRQLDDQRLVFAVPEWLLLEHLHSARQLADACDRDTGLDMLVDGFGSESEGADRLLELMPVRYVRLVAKAVTAGDRGLGDLIRKAHDHGALVIAPHVERSETLVELTQLGVDFLQGHFIQLPQARPVSKRPGQRAVGE